MDWLYLCCGFYVCLIFCILGVMNYDWNFFLWLVRGEFINIIVMGIDFSIFLVRIVYFYNLLGFVIIFNIVCLLFMVVFYMVV